MMCCTYKSIQSSFLDENNGLLHFILLVVRSLPLGKHKAGFSLCVNF